jgi:hypothetical protein
MFCDTSGHAYPAGHTKQAVCAPTLNEPTAQGTGGEVVLAQLDPGGHTTQADAPTTQIPHGYMPWDRQVEKDATPAKLYWPREHGSGSDAGSGQAEPDGHTVQFSAPAWEYDPGAHGAGTVFASAGHAKPASQGTHDDEASKLYSPAGHGSGDATGEIQ